jgi:hypothetical protein
MKTSNKLMLSALIIFLVSLTIYNFALKAEYLTGKYRDPYKDFKKIDIKDFDEIELNATDLMYVTIKQGDYAIQQRNTDDPIKFTKVGRRLIVNMDFTTQPERIMGFNRGQNKIVIECPNLKALTTNGHIILVNGKLPKKLNWDSEYPGYWNGEYSVTVKKFTLDSLFVELSGGVMQLDSSKVQSLKVNTWMHSKIHISGSNNIRKANLQINQWSIGELGYLTIPELTYHVSDSASVMFSGTAIKSLVKK